jgi:succinate dehydrogenase / fumarate reductase membrane anchor subunit
MSLRSSLSIAKGLGSAKSGSHHWWMQRVTAIALIPLVIWLLCTLFSLDKPEDVVTLLTRPFPAIAMLLVVLTALYHGCLGMAVIIEDYVGRIWLRRVLIVGIQFFTIVTALTFVLAVLTAYVSALV